MNNLFLTVKNFFHRTIFFSINETGSRCFYQRGRVSLIFAAAVFVLIFAAAALSIPAVFSQTDSLDNMPPELLSLAKELNCNSKIKCKNAFNEDLNKGVALAQKHRVYDKNPEAKKLAQTFQQEVLAKLASAGENFEEELVEIAEGIVNKNKKLADLLKINKENVTAAKTIISQVREEGVTLDVCSRPANSLPEGDIIRCLNASKKLAENNAENNIVENYIPEDRLNRKLIDQNKSIVSLDEALKRGEYSSLGASSAEQAGEICLRPDSPPEQKSVCDEIASRFFGPEGVEYLKNVRQQVSNVAERYIEKATNFVLIAPTGEKIIGEGAIRKACNDAFNGRKIEFIKVCGDFSFQNGFITEKEFKKSMNFVQSTQEGVNLAECRINPQNCRQYIPQKHQQEFNAGQEAKKIIEENIGFDPSQCEQGGVDSSIAEQCLAGSMQALPQLKSLAQRYPQVKGFIDKIEQNIGESERIRKAQQQMLENNEGPGGCNSLQTCFVHCATPENVAGCVVAGVQQGVFTPENAVSRFQQYNQHINNAASFSGEGPYYGFQPVGLSNGQPPGQMTGFIEPGKGFAQPQFNNFSAQQGPSSDCFAAIYNGDFAEAKKVCPNPTTSENMPRSTISTCPAMPTVSSCPSGFKMRLVWSSPECGPYYDCRQEEVVPVCPKDQYWNGNACVYPENRTCPEGQRWNYQKGVCEVFKTPKEDCEKAGGQWQPEGNYCQMVTPCQRNQYWNPISKSCENSSCPPGQYLDNGVCRTSTVDPAEGCKRSGGFWENNYCKMPVEKPCPEGQWWDGAKCRESDTQGKTCPPDQYFDYQDKVCKVPNNTDPIEGCGKAGGQWQLEGKYCQMPGQSCPYGQYWNGDKCVAVGCYSIASESSCRERTDCVWYNHSDPDKKDGPRGDGKHCDDRTHGQQGNYQPPSGQKEQIWNDKGLRSWIRSDADPLRIEALKTACANVSPSAYVWTRDAGNPSSLNFGMPDPDKCAKAVGCLPGQNFNGNDCTTYQGNQTGTNATCPEGQYWNNGTCSSAADGCRQSGGTWDSTRNYCNMSSVTTACNNNRICEYGESTGSCPGDCGSTTTGESSMKKCFYPNASKNGQALGYTVWCESNYYNCHQGDASGSVVPLDGLSLGGPSSCESGYSVPLACPSGQYWNGSACGSSSSTNTTGCSPNQYWNGTACVDGTSANNNCSSPSTCFDQSVCTSSGWRWDNGGCWSSPQSNNTNTTTACPGGQYWNGSMCVSSNSTNDTTASGSTNVSGSTGTEDPAAACARGGGAWNSETSTCAMQQSSLYSQGLLAALSEALKSIIAILQNMIR